jgi:hypothetical protein
MMHKLALHVRLTNYISKLDLGKTEVEDGYYKFMIQLKVDTKADMVHIRHSSFEKYLGDVESIQEAEFTEIAVKEPIKKTTTTTEYKALSYLEMIGWGALIIYVLRNIYYGY